MERTLCFLFSVLVHTHHGQRGPVASCCFSVMNLRLKGGAGGGGRKGGSVVMMMEETKNRLGSEGMRE